MKKNISILMVLALSLSLLVACGGKSQKSSKDSQFTWWIDTTDGSGLYYSDYSDNMAVQWLNAQYWDVDNHTLGSEENGKKLNLSFQTPVTGAEADNFSTMIATGEYPEIISLSYSSQSTTQLVEDGVLMDITDYVKDYMPNYVQILEENPELKKFTTVTDEEGNDRYYSIYAIFDGLATPWQGYMYRRDWLVKYAKPTEYIWDWDSEYVKDKGHPKYTPLSLAEEKDDYTGWKENTLTSFTFSYGEDPDNDWIDNVVFPSGKTDPYTISDWEWMLDAFSIALEEKGFSNDTDSYAMSLYYLGFMETGDLVSSFGGGGPDVYKDEEGKAAFGGTSDNFKSYLECMNTWYANGWIDTKFETRSSDMFFDINPNGYNQGKVGLWVGGLGVLGSTIRTTAKDPEDQKDAMVFACSLPINDVYGDENNKYKEPDMLYQGSAIGGNLGITTASEGKDLETLFTMLNYLQTYDGAKLVALGLSNEQYSSMEFSPDYYEEYGIDRAYTLDEKADMETYVLSVDASSDYANAIKAQRLISRGMSGHAEAGYVFDRGYSNVTGHGVDSWLRYESKAQVLDYTSLMDDEDSSTVGKIGTYISDYMSMVVPDMIKNGLSDWEDYSIKLNKYNPEQLTDIYQKQIDK